MSDLFERILLAVEKPARYVGGEVNSCAKPDAAGRMALCFPDVYEIGMSHLGLRILYSVVNAIPDLAAERCFAPWPDMADALRTASLPLTTLETRTPIARCDVIGFSLMYELTFTTVLEMLDLAGVPLHASDRTDSQPLVIGGGPCAFNPEPLAPFFDAFLIGDGDEAAVEILRTAVDQRRRGRTRAEILASVGEIEGVYVPSSVGVRTGRFVTVPDVMIPRRTIRQLDAVPFPARTVVPNIPITHDRVAVEIMRGCPQRCRFCQASVIYRPTRFRDPNSVLETAVCGLSSTGHDEVGLCSLSSGDYPYLEEVSRTLMEHEGSRKTSLSLSSLRASGLSEALSAQVARGRKTGFTIAPEAGSQRLRDVLSKNITEEMIMDGCREAFGHGWNSLKLYFMIGLPTETWQDIDEIIELVARIGRTFPKKNLTVSVSSFVPKSHTPFQWAAQDPVEVLREKQERLRGGLRRVRGTQFKYHQVEMSRIEAVMSRGDRRVAPAIEEAWCMGQRFDGWSEKFDPARWEEAIEKSGVDPSIYTGPIPLDEPLPWDHLATTIPKPELLLEWERARRGEVTRSCLETPCGECRACRTREGESLQRARVVVQPLPPIVQKVGTRGPFIYRGFFEKQGPAAFFSQLDMTRAFRMALRRSGAPLAFTEGFNPLPKMSFGPPLPVGIVGLREVLDLALVDEIHPDHLRISVNLQLPHGFRFERWIRLPGLKSHIARDLAGALYETAPTAAALQADPSASPEDRKAIRAFTLVGDRLHLLVHPEARIDALFEQATAERRGRDAFRRRAMVVQGEDWRAFVEGPARIGEG